MKTNIYKRLLESKLIQRFKEEFHEKLGYYPIVITDVTLFNKQSITMTTLDKLKSYFDPFLPKQYHKIITLDSKCRIREAVELRHIYCYIARKMGYSLNEIAKSLDNRDHTTVINSLTKFNNLVETHEPFREKYLHIVNHIKSIDNESSTMADKHQISDQPQSDLLT